MFFYFINIFIYFVQQLSFLFFFVSNYAFFTLVILLVFGVVQCLSFTSRGLSVYSFFIISTALNAAIVFFYLLAATPTVQVVGFFQPLQQLLHI